MHTLTIQLDNMQLLNLRERQQNCYNKEHTNNEKKFFLFPEMTTMSLHPLTDELRNSHQIVVRDFFAL